MAVTRNACPALLLVILLAGSTAARKGPRYDDDGGRGDDDDYNPRGRDYLVQGESRFNQKRPKDPTPLAPSSAGPYAIAHRGSSGELPEHTIEDYDQAIKLGADFIECDISVTKDGVLICRHEPNLSNTTNADDIFPDRIKTYTIDFAPSIGVHSVDLTLAEVKQLRARQRVFARDQSYNDMFQIPTVQEYIDLALDAKRVVGIYPETKHPIWHDSFNLLGGRSMTRELLRILKKNGYRGRIDSKEWLKQPVFIQSFETKNLADIRPLTDLPLVQLLSSAGSAIPDQGTGQIGPNGTAGTAVPGRRYAELIVDSGLKEIAKYADAVGPDKGIIAPVTGGQIRYTTDFIKRAHNAGLQVHPYTFRNEPVFFARNLSPPTIMSEFELHFEELGADGAFADFIEAMKFYFRARRANSQFPRRQIFPQVSTATNATASL